MSAGAALAALVGIFVVGVLGSLEGSGLRVPVPPKDRYPHHATRIWPTIVNVVEGAIEEDIFGMAQKPQRVAQTATDLFLITHAEGLEFARIEAPSVHVSTQQFALIPQFKRSVVIDVADSRPTIANNGGNAADVGDFETDPAVHVHELVLYDEPRPILSVILSVEKPLLAPSDIGLFSGKIALLLKNSVGVGRTLLSFGRPIVSFGRAIVGGSSTVVGLYKISNLDPRDENQAGGEYGQQTCEGGDRVLRCPLPEGFGLFLLGCGGLGLCFGGCVSALAIWAGKRSAAAEQKRRERYSAS